MIDIQQYIESRKALITSHLSLLLEEQKEAVPTYLFQAARYSIFPTGKLFRPMLVFVCGEAFGAETESLLSPACALELIHTYSLIHDDLPCMDDDDYRRGKPSLHKAYPEAHAVLTGDFLLTYAFEILSTADNLSAEQKIALVHSLSTRAGREGMVGGQALDIAFTGKSLDWNILKEIHLGKTAALVQAAVEFGAIIGGVDSKQMQVLQNFSKCLGLAFQIQDDILDVKGSMQILGKPNGSDLKKQKNTSCDILGVQDAEQKVMELLKEAEKELSTLSIETYYLKQLIHTIFPKIL